MINPHSRCSLSPHHGNDPPATTAVVVATVGGYSSCLLRMTADEGGVGDDTCLTSGRMCTCVLLTSSASIDLYFYLPFLVAATHFAIFLKRSFGIYFPYHSNSCTSLFSSYLSHPFLPPTSPSFMLSFTRSCPLFPSSDLLPCAPLLHQHLPAGSERRLYPPRAQASGEYWNIDGSCLPSDPRGVHGCTETKIVNFKKCDGNAVADGGEVEWNKWRKRKRESAEFPLGDSIYESEHVNPILTWTFIHLSWR